MENITKEDFHDLVKELRELKDLKAELKDSVKETVGEELSKWKPGIDRQIHGLQVAVDLLQQYVYTDKFHDAEEASPRDLTDPAAGTSQGEAPAHDLAQQSPPASGHGIATPARMAVDGGPTAPSIPPSNGTVTIHNPLISQQLEFVPNYSQQQPVMSFPVFDGENPQLWKDLCEQYFTVFNIQESYWVQMATLNFSPSTAVWLQAVRKKLLGCTWEAFCSTLCVRFGRDRHQQLIRQFYAIKQLGSVQEYIDAFENLMNQLLSYSDEINPYYFLMRFVGGLRADLRAAVMVQRPPDLDAACALALVQEEVHEGYHQEFGRPLDSQQRVAVRLQHAPVEAHSYRQGAHHQPVDRRVMEPARATRPTSTPR